ncbi:S26A2 protein, partial [Polypterus senegalus]
MSASVAVYRSLYTEDHFRQVYGSPGEPASGELRERIRGRCKCSRQAYARVIRARVPVLDWLPRYRLRRWLLGDAIAGLTVGIVHIPQGMAFALLTSVAPIYGLYTSFFPAILYMLFGTGKHISTGTFAVISLMTGSVVEQLAPRAVDLNSTSPEAKEIEEQRIGVAAAVAFLSGLLMICMFLLQLGFLSTYLSEPIVKAFTSAAAFHVTISQLPNMLGLRLPRHTGPFTIFKVPALDKIPSLAGDTVAITFVGYAVSVSLAMIYADKHGYTIHPNQELLAHGISNMVSSLFTCFPSSATLATTNILESAGGHTQVRLQVWTVGDPAVARFVSVFFVPQAVLACINVTSLRQMFLQFQDLPELWRVSRIDFVVWIVTWLSVIVLNVDLGLAIGVVFSMMTIICRTQRAECAVLGRASNTEIYRSVKSNSKCQEIPGLKILSYNGPIYYGNRSFFREAMANILGLTPERIRKLEKAQRALEKRKMSIATVDGSAANTSFASENELFKAEVMEGSVQAVLIDCSSVIFIDIAGARLFIQMCIECQKAGVRVYLAMCNESILKILTHSGLMNYMSPRHIFVTVHDAVVHIEQMKLGELASKPSTLKGGTTAAANVTMGGISLNKRHRTEYLLVYFSIPPSSLLPHHFMPPLDCPLPPARSSTGLEKFKTKRQGHLTALAHVGGWPGSHIPHLGVPTI